MQYITTYSFQSPSEKTELAPAGKTVEVTMPPDDAFLDSFFKPPAPYAHIDRGLLPMNGARPIDPKDDFNHFLARAKAASK